MSTNFNPYLQHNGTFQLRFQLDEFDDLKTASRQVWLNGLYKIRLTGVAVSSSIDTGYWLNNNSPDTVLNDMESYSYGSVLQLTSPQMLNSVTETPGFLIPNQNNNLNSLVSVQETNAATGEAYLVSKMAWTVGDILNNWVAVNFSSNRIDFQLSVCRDSTTFYALNSVDGWGLYPPGWIVMTFQYESLKL